VAFFDARAFPCDVLGPVCDGFDFGMGMQETREGASGPANAKGYGTSLKLKIQLEEINKLETQ
jgi:hypothetical protein